MTDRELVFNFLDMNYDLTVCDSKYIFKDIITGRNLLQKEFFKEIQLIFGDFGIPFVKERYKLEQISLRKKNKEFLSTLDQSKGTIFILKSFSDNPELCNKYFEEGLIKSYFKKYFLPKLILKINNFDKNKNSSALIETINDDMKIEVWFIEYYAEEYFNKWYDVNVLEDKINIFLSRLHIEIKEGSLGTDSWVVVLKDYGEVTRRDLLNKFIEEEFYHKQKILTKYYTWYESMVKIENAKLSNKKVISDNEHLPTKKRKK